MRILFCNKYNFPFSGTEVYLFELMDLLRAKGHVVELFSMADPRGGPWQYQQDFVPHLDFKSERTLWQQAGLAGHAIYSIDARKRLKRVLDDFRPFQRRINHVGMLFEQRAHGFRVPVPDRIHQPKIGSRGQPSRQ